MRGLPDSAEDAEVQLYIAGKPVGAVTTDDHGRAMIECMLSRRSAGAFAARAAWPGGEQSASGRFLVWASERAAIAVDVDRTIHSTDQWPCHHRRSSRSRFRAPVHCEPPPQGCRLLVPLARMSRDMGTLAEYPVPSILFF